MHCLAREREHLAESLPQSDEPSTLGDWPVRKGERIAVRAPDPDIMHRSSRCAGCTIITRSRNRIPGARRSVRMFLASRRSKAAVRQIDCLPRQRPQIGRSRCCRSRAPARGRGQMYRWDENKHAVADTAEDSSRSETSACVGNYIRVVGYAARWAASPSSREVSAVQTGRRTPVCRTRKRTTACRLRRCEA
jgi:hypothetical protein